MDIEWGVVITQLGGGLALFLYGMHRMTQSLKVVAGSGMKNLLARLTTNRFTAAVAGAVITAVIQSSSVTTVLVVGFISAGLLNLSQSIGVILGANVGTTMTAQIVAFQIYKYGLLLIAAGYFTEILARRERLRQWGSATMGLGLIFFGMELMSIATGPFRDWPPFIGMMESMSYTWLAVLVGAAFTAIVQSSSATTGIVIVLASQGLITLESGIGLILGANVGTCVTAFLSSIGSPREARQAAVAHVVFNVGGVLLWIFFVDQLADFVRLISPVSEELQGIERVAADTPRQVANAHTVFNLANLAVFIWFAGPIARLTERLVPARPLPVGIRPKFLNDYYLNESAMALDVVRRELVHLAGLTGSMIRNALQTALHGDEQDTERLSAADNDVDVLYGEIIRYLGKLSQSSLVADQPRRLNDFVAIANYLENIGDVIEKDLVPIAAKRRRLNVEIDAETEAKLKALENEVCAGFDNTIAAIDSGDADKALDVLESKAAVRDLAEDLSADLALKLAGRYRQDVDLIQVEADIVEIYRRLNTLSRRIARLAVDATLRDASSESSR
ncbi:MAG: Na/Pi cotransporter family protein [Woeseiaceae bacterium]|nr:Na/Pi cotransporter family protein [Woeseiaceae bacterium]